MGTKLFLRAGLVSSVLAALAVLALIWLALSLPIWFRWKLGFYAQFLFPVIARGAVFSFGLLGVLVFPYCWYRLIFRAQDYELRKLIALVFGSYALSWFAIMVCYYPVILRDKLAVRGQFSQSVMDAGFSALFGSFSIAVMGAGVLFLLYTLIAFPVAALQRALLLQFFR